MMTTPEVLNALADRVEREEPSRALDAAIKAAVVSAPRGGMPKPYTASLDAAVTLVPEGWTLDHLGDCGYGRPGAVTITGAKAEITNSALHFCSSDAATRPCALTAAALRARAADMQDRFRSHPSGTA